MSSEKIEFTNVKNHLHTLLLEVARTHERSQAIIENEVEVDHL